MRTVKEVSELTGVSVRTLHHYDAIGLLTPTGVNTMEFGVFDKSALEACAQEAKARWGGTAAYQESEKKSAGRTPEEERRLGRDMMALFGKIGALRDRPPTDGAVQEKIAALRQFITEHYYHCTKEILRGLGEMYVSDERFQKNIDQAGGEGTAEFVSHAIAAYCGN